MVCELTFVVNIIIFWFISFLSVSILLYRYRLLITFICIYICVFNNVYFYCYKLLIGKFLVANSCFYWKRWENESLIDTLVSFRKLFVVGMRANSTSGCVMKVQTEFLMCVSLTAHVRAIDWTPVHLSIHHTLVLCWNGSIYRQTVLTAWYPHDSSFQRYKIFPGIPMVTHPKRGC